MSLHAIRCVCESIVPQSSGLPSDVCKFSRLQDSELTEAREQFKSQWNPLRYPCPPVEHIFRVTNHGLDFQWNKFRQSLPKEMQQVEKHYHGTSLLCEIAFSSPCSRSDCGICGISKIGMSTNRIKEEALHRCGHAFYFSPTPAKSHEYTTEIRGRRAMLVLDVIPGNIYDAQGDHHLLDNPPEGYDSVCERSRNFDILAVYETKRVIPRYIVIYSL